MDNSAHTPDEVAELAKAYLRRGGMHIADFARHIGYSYNTIGRWLAGTYARGKHQSDRKALCQAVIDFIAQHPIDSPEDFQGHLYELGNVRALRGIFQALTNQPCILLAYAPPGSGKTDVARALIPQMRSNATPIFRVYCSQNITRRDLMHAIAEKCGSIVDASIRRTIANLKFDFRNRRAAIYFDEAQHLSIDCLETVRELYDEMGWSLCFAGSHKLDRIFTEWAGELEQLERRITDKIYIPSVTAEEAEQIIQSEIPGLARPKARLLIESSHVQLKDGKQYLSIGRVMANIKELQKLIPDVPVPISTNPVQEEVA